MLDVVQNSITAGSLLTTISVSESTADDRMVIEIADTGRGMTAEQVNGVTDPFFTTRKTRKVGLGIPLFKLAAEQTGGGLSIRSEVGAGTVVTAVFVPSSVDMTPLGDINSTVAILIRMNPELNFIYNYSFNGTGFSLDTRELRRELDGVPLDNEDVQAFIMQYLNENTAESKSGISKEG